MIKYKNIILILVIIFFIFIFFTNKNNQLKKEKYVIKNKMQPFLKEEQINESLEENQYVESVKSLEEKNYISQESEIEPFDYNQALIEAFKDTPNESFSKKQAELAFIYLMKDKIQKDLSSIDDNISSINRIKLEEELINLNKLESQYKSKL